MATNQRRLLLLIGLFILALGAYLMINMSTAQMAYALPRRLEKVVAVLLAGFGVAVSSILFQTITHNRILTPSIIGFDSLYLLIQGGVLFIFGSTVTGFLDESYYFLLNVALMVVFAELLFRFLFQREQSYIYFILLAGVVCGMLFRSAFSFFMLLLDPDQFYVLQNKMFASFNLIPTNLLGLAAVLTVVAIIYGWPLRRELDVFVLGRENAHNLGIDTARLQKRVLRVIALLVAVATALVGPITFLGLLVVNVAYQLLATYRHSILIVGTVLISWVALLLGLVVVEHALDFATNLTVIINGIGGSYFLYLLLKEGKSC
ncbi:iron chelate uptake ABC transporter family permease subunit [Veillonella sp. R32]|uniref:iron chelate uptake ABC transporter family permease subunit n=1 Tax=Veillonella sp. R32 TaxID=2021312 RepID=UPI001389E8B7|nr:iron chelate uptake ABC transporter family permease subunit [Veillonella sp. R32]KAF1683603.1 iron ABC transporter permease [Veillonella sp. R32]